MIFSALLTLGMGMGLTYGLVNEVLGVGSSSRSELAYTIPYSILGFGVWIIHYWSYSKMSKNKESKMKAEDNPKMNQLGDNMGNKYNPS
jgi:hypothetical protein